MKKKKNDIRRLTGVVFLLLFACGQDGKPPNLGEFSSATDVGTISITGTSFFDTVRQSYKISGSGENIWLDKDAFHFLWRQMKGDFIFRARVSFLGEGTHPHRKIGLMLRESLAADARHISGVVHGDGLTSLQYREKKAGETREKKLDLSGADVLQLERRGMAFIMSAARFGQPFRTVEMTAEIFPDSVYAGLFVCSHNDSTIETAVFDNVRFVVPAKPDFIPYQDYIGSRLELLEITTGRRIIRYTSSASLQAPNWTPDGKSLIYNRDGRLYRFTLSTDSITEIPTDFAINNNNDHVVSFDGKRMGISHHVEAEDWRSVIFTLPADGGVPVRITPLAPSYLHGWSPDGKWLVYTGERNGQFDIYRIPAAGGKEAQLTNTTGLDDGSEYDPFGEYIYFNSNRTGTMQIWRMEQDGSNQTQLTFDEYNDWFPHISPDGKEIVFLSYLPEVDSGDHPFYKQVYLRRMNVEKGHPVVVAYLYGGQGTINVYSWSPDGQRIAFISNSQIGENQ